MGRWGMIVNEAGLLYANPSCLEKSQSQLDDVRLRGCNETFRDISRRSRHSAETILDVVQAAEMAYV